MIFLRGKNDIARLRRIVLSSQGLLRSKPFGSGVSGSLKAINHIGYVQIDTIAVVERAHHHVLFSRVPKYNTGTINQLLKQRDIFEYWSHAAAFLPIQDFRFSLPYKNAIKSGQVHWYKEPDRKLMNALLERIRLYGPLKSRDLDKEQRSKSDGWWDWKPAKKALEQLYMEGDLMVSHRDGMEKIYDITERLLPDGLDITPPSVEEFADHLIDQQLRSYGLVSTKTATYLRRNGALRNAVKNSLAERLLGGELENIKLENGDEFVLQAGALDLRAPVVNERVHILSPFDPLVIQRERLKSIFGFDYQIECYVPQTKRSYGYFCLPILYRDQFVGRMDCKAHRLERRLEIKALFLEAEIQDFDRFLVSFADSITRFSELQKCTSYSFNNIYSKKLEAAVRTAFSNEVLKNKT